MRQLAHLLRRHGLATMVILLWSLSLRWWEGEVLWETHSPGFEPARMMGVVDAWAHGIADARWFPSFDAGYGYPILSYHSPLFSWVGAAFLSLTGLPVLSLRLAVLSFFATGAVGCWHFAANWWGEPGATDRRAGDLALVGWASATYLMTNLFVRGSFAEFAAGCFVPWILYGMHLLGASRRLFFRGGIVIAVSLALVVLSHNAIAVYMLILLAGPLPLLLRPDGGRGWCALVAAGAMGALGSAFFAVAAALEKQWVGLDNVLVLQVQEHFLGLRQLFSFQHWNLGLSGQGEEFTMPRHQGPLLPLAIGGALVSLPLLPTRAHRRRTGILLLLASLTLAMTMPLSAPLWRTIPLLGYTQFPWRWLSLNAVFLAAMLPAFDAALAARGEQRSRHGYATLVAMTFLVSLAIYGGPSSRWPRQPVSPDIASLRAVPTRTALADEYGPVWRSKELTHPVPAGEARVEGSQAVKAAAPGTPWRWDVGARSTSSSTIVGVHYFPGWRAWWSGTEGTPARELAVENQEGLVRVSLPPGTAGTLVLEFGDTPLRKGLKAVGLLALIGGFGLFVAVRRGRRAIRAWLLCCGAVVATTALVLGASNLPFWWHDRGDFLAFWTGTVLMAGGHSPYDPGLQATVQAGLGFRPEIDGIGVYQFLPFFYPPWFTFLFLPFLALPYAWAKLTWSVMCAEMLVAGVLLARSLLRTESVVAVLLATLLCGEAVKAVWLGQTAPLVLFLTSLAWWCMDTRRDIGAGIALAVLTIKPQLSAFVLAGLLLWSLRQRRMRVVASFAASLGVLVTCATVAQPGWLPQMLQATSVTPLLYRVVPGTGTSWLVVLSSLGLEGPALQLWWAALAVPALLLLTRLALAPRTTVADVVCAGMVAPFFAAPYTRAYDFTVLLLPALILAGSRLPKPGGAGLVFAMTVLVDGWILRLGSMLHGQDMKPGVLHPEYTSFWLPMVVAAAWTYSRLRPPAGDPSMTSAGVEVVGQARTGK